MSRKSLKIQNARENNLRDLSTEIPHDSLVILTGLSGSGKSSLAFDTVYAEGQRRYIETFSPYTRQFFDKVKKPDVDHIENVRPAIAIQQRTRVTGSRSTVGSMTNINDYLKVLWSNIATAVCLACGAELQSWTAPSLADHLIALRKDHGIDVLYVCAPVSVPAGGAARTKELARLEGLGFTRVFDRGTGEVSSLDDLPADAGPGLLFLVDRFKGAELDRKRVSDSIDQAFSLSGGTAVVIDPASPDAASRASWTAREFHNRFTCPSGHMTLESPRPALFSFNNPVGACPECRGFGKVLAIDPSLVVANPGLSIREGAISCWAGESCRGELRRLHKFCEKVGIDLDKPWHELPERDRDAIFSHKSRDFVGLNAWFKRKEEKSYKMHVRMFLARYRGQFDCPTCRGTRLKPDALAYRVAGRTLPEIWDTPIGDLITWLEAQQASLASRDALPRQLADLFVSILTRLRYLNDLGLPYLTLDRQARTLSGGETQRVNLATALGSDLISTHFVLDEPSVGLHPRDTDRLTRAMRQLQAAGNSVMVVEHDLECIAEADTIIELGPRAGKEGGQIVFQGPREEWKGIDFELPEPRADEAAASGPALTVLNARARNLKGFDLRIPLERFVVLTGVSGSGKSSLVSEVLMRAYDLHRMKLQPETSENLVTGFEQLDQVLMVDQAPLAKSPRANIATYSGIWDHIREALAATDEARTRALSKSAFSFNVEGGRCPACSGAGFVREDMQFLSDVYIPCDVCLGKRFLGPVLEVHHRGKNVFDFLQMSVDECASFFQGVPSVRSAAETLSLLGLGHLTLGHPLSELSGGEAQRLKLVPFIEQSGRGRSLLIFDEPTTGLHVHDIMRLLELFSLLRERGHSILCIEHNLILVGAADWIIDLGPEGGHGGGDVILRGTPKSFLSKEAAEHSYTARYLQDLYRAHGAKAKRAPAQRRTKRDAPARDALKITGAREHNLKNITVDVPLNQVVALTGLSGSGKSSIAKDIIYAEGQRRYLDCLSPYARQFIKELRKPDIDSITNVQPTICVYQHTFQPSRLSTVATMSEIYNFLRLLYAKTATQYCPNHPDEAISPLSPPEMAREIKEMRTKSVRILAPIIKLKKGYHKPVFERATESEIFEVRVDGNFANPSRFEEGLEKNKAHTIEYVVARFNPAQMEQALIEEAVQQALSLAGGTLVVHADGRDTVYSMERTCPKCKTGFFKPDPEDLSFNSRRGVCPECEGTGVGSRGRTCPECGGARIGPVGRNLRIMGKNIHEACLQTPGALKSFLHSLELDRKGTHLAAPIITELLGKIETLLGFGLDYILLDRDCTTLSGGELQRLRLATAIGSPLTGAMYIFDEPSIGLHPSDNARILARLHSLKERGNSVIMIEHDSQSILACDHLIEVGPGGGRNGGRIVYNGPLDQVFGHEESLLAKTLVQEVAPQRGSSERTGELTVLRGNRNNIRDLTISLPLHTLVTVGGVSGAGKSSLVHGLIVETITEGKAVKDGWSYQGTTVRASEGIDRVLLVDQKPIGVNSRSTPASYLGVWDDIRKLWASSLEAKARGWTNSHFSYNTGKGRCPACKGMGVQKLEMSFLPDAEVMCDECNGRRYTDETNSVKYLGLSISEALNLTFEEAREVFAKHPRIARPIQTACELGIGYLTLGQNSATLSGGESQRIKLVCELSARPRGHTLYVLDEPTTGLHRADVSRLIKTLTALVALGNTVLVIEHDPDVLAASGHVVEMGPGPGDAGGRVIFEGSPASLAKARTPWGEVLRRLTEHDGPRRAYHDAASTEAAGRIA